MKDFICFLVHLIFYGCFLQCFSSAVKQTLDVLQAERHGERCFLCRDSWLKDVNAKIQGLTLFISAHLVIWSIDFSSPGLACSVFSEERGWQHLITTQWTFSGLINAHGSLQSWETQTFLVHARVMSCGLHSCVLRDQTNVPYPTSGQSQWKSLNHLDAGFQLAMLILHWDIAWETCCKYPGCVFQFQVSVNSPKLFQQKLLSSLQNHVHHTVDVMALSNNRL